ncbi:MAG: hypothetical protein JSV30_02365 [Candidatus Omnitrophota bacterium]|nr:MAG: hypothetical protein JSV30_02365 [Candidatus Omnitrophota bacterium]
MKSKIENKTGCRRTLSIEVSNDDLKQEFDRVYAEIGNTARIPGFRPGKAPRDLLEANFGQKAKEEVVKRAIPAYYLKAVKEENLVPVAPPEINNVQFKNETLFFNATVDVEPQVKIKSYKDLKVIKKKVKVEQAQVDMLLDRLQKAKHASAKDDAFAKSLGFQTFQELEQSARKDLEANAEKEIKMDMERQILDQLLKRATMDVPESLVHSQGKELLNQIKLNRVLQGTKKEEVESKEKELELQAKNEAIYRIKVFFILEKIAEMENIQLSEEDLHERIAGISHSSGKSEKEVMEYLEKQNLLASLKAETRSRKIMKFLLANVKIE